MNSCFGDGFGSLVLCSFLLMLIMFTIDFELLLFLLVGDEEVIVLLFFNWGCPYCCDFCSNCSVYSRFLWGDVVRVFLEMDSVVLGW